MPDLAALAHTLLSALQERQEALHVPFLGDDVPRILSVVLVPSWATYEDGVEAMELLVVEGLVERVTEDELEPLAGHGLPLRRYWAPWVRPRVAGGADRVDQGWTIHLHPPLPPSWTWPSPSR